MAMATKKTFLFLFLVVLFSTFVAPALAAKKTYIVYLGAHKHGKDATSLHHELATNSHYELLGSVLGSKDKAKDAIIYSYNKFINGFSAVLEEEEANAMAENPNVVSVFPDGKAKLLTTHSWDFVGLERGGRVPEDSLWLKSRFGENTIIATLDTGVWPESQSFQDGGMGPVPSSWKGSCQNTTKEARGVTCNRKLIGAKYYYKGFAESEPIDPSLLSARDSEGHGTHTLSTAAGRFVPGANTFGFAKGTAKGGSPNARVATYKVCWPGFLGGGCADSDIMAAVDDAIHDGVDVLSMSIGGGLIIDYWFDSIAIATFHAVANGVTVVLAGGNSGPALGLVSNIAPWMITVAASSIDRLFESDVVLGNGQILKGQSLADTQLVKQQYPVIDSLSIRLPNATIFNATYCSEDALDLTQVKGKIVACKGGENFPMVIADMISKAGGVGMILANNGNDVIVDQYMSPATTLTYEDGLALYDYINSTKNPTAYIMPGRTTLHTKPAPVMANFSSQGPNFITPDILKPDITAPGVNIIAAYPLDSPPSEEYPSDSRRVSYNVLSGTSMATPHVTGVVGLLKSLYPHWSPAMIRSAIMTTATIKDNTGAPIKNASLLEATPFSYGSGHIRPNHTMYPGLVYDLTVDDYLNFLCGLNYTSTKISLFTNNTFTCPKNPPNPSNLNYPSITITYTNSSINVTRTLKNVGPPGTYTAHVTTPTGVSVKVEPTMLVFDQYGEEKSFMVSFEYMKGKVVGVEDAVFGGLVWSDGVHNVWSPLTVNLGGIPSSSS